MIFADLTPTPVQLAGFLACAVFLAAGYNQVMKIVDRWKGRPSPGEVREEAAQLFARQRDFEIHIASNEKQFALLEIKRDEDLDEASDSRKIIYDKIDHMRSELFEAERRISAAGEARIEKVHDRISDVLGEVREIRGKTNKL